MPEMFGTHHTKAMVLFRHDDLAQVVILTANFIERDFRMSQAIFRTPLLPLQTYDQSPTDPMPPLGSGPRFKHDLLAYFRGYSRNGTTTLQDLISQLQKYDFSDVRGALIGSIPGLQMPGQFEPEEQDRIGRWGLPALKHVLSSIPTNPTLSSNVNPEPQIIAQVSSIASVGEKWLRSSLIPTLSTIKPPVKPSSTPSPNPKVSIIFPTTSSIRNSLDGYESGSSIHIKITSTAQAKQLTFLKPMLCHWSLTNTPNPTNHHQQDPLRSSGRSILAPHIKTYIRFSSPSLTTIDWALLTSANLSTQAWGSSSSSGGGGVKISSYELGVLVWPALWDDSDPSARRARMVPVFGSDMPPPISSSYSNDDDDNDTPPSSDQNEESASKSIVVGWRMPYDLPLTPYRDDENPWCASEPCDEPDWIGRVWPGYGR